jgi:hypothetical protein
VRRSEAATEQRRRWYRGSGSGVRHVPDGGLPIGSAEIEATHGTIPEHDCSGVRSNSAIQWSAVASVTCFSKS